LTAGAEVTAWAGGKVPAWIIGGLDVDVQAGGDVSGYIQSQQGDVSIWTGGNLSSSTVKAKGDVSIEVAGEIFGGLQWTKIEAGGNASVLANGDIITPVEAEWVADVRSANGRVLSAVTTRRTLLSDSDSPASQRLAEIADELAWLTDQGLADSDAAQDLRAESELLAVKQYSVDFRQLPATRVREMIRDGVVKEYTGGPIDGYAANGYVVIADVAGREAYWMVLEPYKYSLDYSKPTLGGYETDYNPDHGISQIGTANPAQGADFYKTVKRVTLTLPSDSTPEGFRSYNLTDTSVGTKVSTVIADKKAGVDDTYRAALEFGLGLDTSRQQRK
jgi:hypothetical protein